MKPILENLSPGARRCLRLFEWFWKTHGPDGCWPKVPFLARKLNVSVATVKRWTMELARAGVLRKQRRGPKSNCYRVGQPADTRQMLLPLVENSVENAENELSFEPSSDGVSMGESCELEPEQAETPEVPRKKPPQAQGPDEAEVSAVRRTVEAFAVAGCGARLIERLFSIGKFYCVNGFQIAAELGRALGEVERRPSTAPRGPGWFPIVLEAKLKRQWDSARKTPARAVTVTPERSPGGEWCGDFTRGLVNGLMSREASPCR